MFSAQQYRAATEGAGLFDRSDRGRLKLTGNDRRAYLQGLLTNDIEALESGQGCYAALLTPQGRMISDMRVWELGDAVLMDLPADLAPAVRDRFDQFIFSEDVQVADVTSSLAQVAIYGPAAPDVLSGALAAGAASGDASPDREQLDGLRPYENRRWDFGGEPAFVMRSDELGVGGFDVFVDAARKGDLVALLHQSGALDVSAETAEVLRVESGRPLFHYDMDEDTIPLEAGIEDRAISQTKGCYVGQEIIIRVLHRGHGRVARRLVGLTMDRDAAVPARGARIRSGEREIGAVTSAVLSSSLDRAIAMGYVHRDFVEPGTQVTVADGERPAPAVVTRLPFRATSVVAEKPASR
jgi:folate-binding protein YgfZ